MGIPNFDYHGRIGALYGVERCPRRFQFVIVRENADQVIQEFKEMRVKCTHDGRFIGHGRFNILKYYIEFIWFFRDIIIMSYAQCVGNC